MVGPAYAGMVLLPSDMGRSLLCRPRVRGDGPRLQARMRLCRWSAPRTRGWSAGYAQLLPPSRVGPAYAGMVHLVRGRRPGIHRRPRVRGDGPTRDVPRNPPRTSAPRTRGWSDQADEGSGERAVGPAYAGMVLSPRSGSFPDIGRPRVRGDGPPGYLLDGLGAMSAPRTRGWSALDYATQLAETVGPAYAGMVRMSCPPPARVLCRPRARGDGPNSCVRLEKNQRSAPRTRG